VKNPCAVRVGDRLSHPPQIPRRCSRSERPGPGQVREGRSLDQFHRNKGLPRPLANFMHGDDARVSKPGCRTCFRQKPGLGRRFRPPTGKEHLHRHPTLQTGLTRLIHHAHAAASQFPNQNVLPSLAQFPQSTQSGIAGSLRRAGQSKRQSRETPGALTLQRPFGQ
jgi:hypothetical protein